jgi:hypothetical protein
MKFIFKCLNHQEETPSLSVDVLKGKYYCFSCGSEGIISESKGVTQLVINHLKGVISYLEGYL